MDNVEFAKMLEARTLGFAVLMIRLSLKLPNTLEGRIIREQLIKAATSIGANYREANRSRSRADFRNKIKICESEASENQYWLDITARANGLSPDQMKKEKEECNAILAIFTSIAKSFK
jgi:four helix bundle protein